jgi:Ulp1 family protease
MGLARICNLLKFFFFFVVENINRGSPPNRLFVPVNLANIHWALVVIDMPTKSVVYYDSMANNGKAVLEVIRLKTKHQKNKKIIETHC